MEKVIIDGSSLSITDIANVCRNDYFVELSEESKRNIKKSREYVDGLVDSGKPTYGINTGFGKFSDVSISKEECKVLQRNLIISHACGVGNHLKNDQVKAVMLLRVNALAKGYSGIRLETVETIIQMINKGVCPIIPEKGSLGASGDLAPLAHMALSLIGEGEACYKGEIIPSSLAMEKAGITPIELVEKEGLALINGTQVMTAIGALTVYDAINLLKLSDIAASLTIEALNGITDPFNEKLHLIRPHKGQIATAKNLLDILKDSERTTSQGELRIQDAYTLRCIPQIHGASKDAVKYVAEKVAIEINSVTDNPVILVDDDLAVSCGNFHGQPMALPFDFLSIALAELANVSERRIERLVNPELSGLPAFLVNDGGLNSGFMIAQYVAAALVSENKSLAHPASVDSIPSSANQEDHVSMGTIAARHASEIYKNAANVLGIEILCAAQGIDLTTKFKNKSLGKGTEAAYSVIRQQIPFVTHDVIMYEYINKAAGVALNNSIVSAVEEEIGEIPVI